VSVTGGGPPVREVPGVFSSADRIAEMEDQLAAAEKERDAALAQVAKLEGELRRVAEILSDPDGHASWAVLWETMEAAANTARAGLEGKEGE
jgi:hypothetical protein